MELLEKKLTNYNDLAYKKITGSKFQLDDNRLKKQLIFNLKGIPINDYIDMDSFHEKLKKLNDFEYVHGHGYYLDGYAEFGVMGFIDPDSSYKKIFEIGKVYSFGNYHFEVSPRSDLFSFLTEYQDESKYDFNTLKLSGVKRESYSVEIEKSLFYIANKFSEDIEEEYKEYLYPRIIDFREAGMTVELFDYTKINEDLDWDSPITNNLSLFNQGESSDNYNFFAYYRFLETFFGKDNEIEELTKLVELINVTELLLFAKKYGLIESNGTAKSLAKSLYQVRNNYVHHKLNKERIFDPTFNIPVQVLSKWKVITREIAIQLLNLHCSKNI